MANEGQTILSEELQQRSLGLVVFESALMMCINILAFTGNMLVCWAVYRNQRLRTIPNIYVGTLAISDALMAVLCMPMSVVLLVTGQWPFSSAVCHFQGFFCFFCALFSLLLMTATAVNRYFRVVKPNLYRQRFKVKSTCISVVAITLFAAFGAGLSSLAQWATFIVHYGKVICFMDFDTPQLDMAYMAYLDVIYISVPIGIITFAYYKIFKTIKHHNEEMNNTRKGVTLRLNVEEDARNNHVKRLLDCSNFLEKMATEGQANLSQELQQRSISLVVFESALMMCINILASTGNMLVCWAVYRNQRLRTIPNIYVVTLAISDALMAVLCMPMSVVLLVTGQWPFSSAVCHFQGFFCFFCALFSLLLMTATAVNRYFRVVKPNLYRQRFKVKSTCISVVAITLFAAFGAGLSSLAQWATFIVHYGKVICFMDFDTPQLDMAYMAYLDVIYISVPIGIITFAYYKIFKTIKHHNEEMNNTRKGVTLRLNVEENVNLIINSENSVEYEENAYTTTNRKLLKSFVRRRLGLTMEKLATHREGSILLHYDILVTSLKRTTEQLDGRISDQI
ncbi:putative G-protein coupled receptor 45 [Stylophora pistillata]|uniref:Putative G-protein coupled receptor 45 n=1 Tax=Stylophora pistillata TaxID=50429 RepID=A0A2B4SWA4_STYPI|nr:putative G-protein coupled receptor 45 [Stylophora pistillata]